MARRAGMRRTIGIFAVALAAGVFPAAAQNYPARPVRVIVTFPAGAATGIGARIVAQKLTELWGQNGIADNPGGGGGAIRPAAAPPARAGRAHPVSTVE